MVVMTQELLLHAKRCMQHEDVVKKILLVGLNRTLDEFLSKEGPTRYSVTHPSHHFSLLERGT